MRCQLVHGAATYGGTNLVLIWANNAYGTGSNLLQVQVRGQLCQDLLQCFGFSPAPGFGSK